MKIREGFVSNSSSSSFIVISEDKDTAKVDLEKYLESRKIQKLDVNILIKDLIYREGSHQDLIRDEKRNDYIIVCGYDEYASYNSLKEYLKDYKCVKDENAIGGWIDKWVHFLDDEPIPDGLKLGFFTEKEYEDEGGGFEPKAINAFGGYGWITKKTFICHISHH